MEYVLTGSDARKCHPVSLLRPMPSPSHTGGIEDLISVGLLRRKSVERSCVTWRNIEQWDTQHTLPRHLSALSKILGGEKIQTIPLQKQLIACLPAACN